MKNGDISNELPKRVIVIADTFFKIEYAITKTKFKVFKSTEKKAKVVVIAHQGNPGNHRHQPVLADPPLYHRQRKRH